MPSMSPRKMAPRSIVIPPRLFFCMSDASDSSGSPRTPDPYTPSPSSLPDFPIINQGVGGMHVDEDVSPPLTAAGAAAGAGAGAGAKRSREEEPSCEPDWTEEEIETVQSTLLHPFRPLSISYPPGDLPPPNAIDELTNQILAYAFRLSPTKRSASSHNSPAAIDEDGTYASRTEGWTHSWEATRKKVFEIALAESKGEVVHRKGRKEGGGSGGVARPGLKRMDSMDFLDEGSDERPPESIGRALRLSTTLQNTAKQELLSTGMSRSSSENSIGSDQMRNGHGNDSPSTSTAHTPVPTAITLTPSSPMPPDLPRPSHLPAAGPPPLLKRRGSARGQAIRRPSSLLQRGKSFTASDLAAEEETVKPSPLSTTGEANMSMTRENDESMTGSPVVQTITEEPRSSLPQSAPRAIHDSPTSIAPPIGLGHPPDPTQVSSSLLGLLEVDTSDNVNHQIGPSLHPPLLAPVPPKPKLNRSVSSSAVLHPHTERNKFLAPHPSSSDRSQLAIPMNLSPDPAQSSTPHGASGGDSGLEPAAGVTGGLGGIGPGMIKTGGGWSDSDDDAPQRPRAIKKIKGGKIKALKVQAQVAGGLSGTDSDGGLRSPFEEKEQLEL